MMRLLTEQEKDILKGLICPYCKKPTKRVPSKEVYGKEYGVQVLICRKCDAYVGCHRNGEALGRCANKVLRARRREAHQYFDKIWKLKLISRTEAYEWLSRMLDLPAEYTHMGMFGEKTCKDVIYFSKQTLNDNRRLDMDFGVEPKTPYYPLD